MRDGLYCEEHRPEESIPVTFNMQFSWKGIIGLCDYLDGNITVEVLDIMEKMRPAIDRRILTQIRSIVGGEIFEPDSESMESGDGDY